VDNLLGHLLTCKQCSKTFVICKSCYRGHKYCSDQCKETGYKYCRDSAREKYEQSVEAKLDHRDRSKRYRNNLQNSVTYKSSKVQSTPVLTNSCNKLKVAFEEIKSSPGVCIVCRKTIFKELLLYGGSV